MDRDASIGLAAEGPVERVAPIRRPGLWPFMTSIVAGALLLLAGAGVFQHASAQEVYRDGPRSLSLSFWGQGWYQFVEEGGDGDDSGAPRDLHDFMLRRAYLSLKGTVTPFLGFFLHVAGDRLGQRSLGNAGVGLGTGLALRDGWMSLRLAGQAAQLQVGRMYIPFTRNYGTTSTKALLAADLDWVQGGYRGGIFYPSTVGRDEGATLWGNLAEGLLQYRIMVADGADDPAQNPGDRLRTAGRLSFSFFEPETGWFNQGSSLGERRVLSLGGGVDRQRLILAGEDRTYRAWTVDFHMDQPLNGGALTASGSYIGIRNAPNGVGFTALSPGSDAGVFSVQAGYLLPEPVGPGRLQPFGTFQRIDVDGDSPDTRIAGLGFNYYLAGHANKLTLEATFVSHRDGDGSISLPGDPFLLTAQLAFGM